MTKTFYLQGKAQGNDTLHETKAFSAELEDRGHINICPWWFLEGITKPYLENREKNAHLAVGMINASFNAEVTVLFAADNILGAATEFGVGLASVDYIPDKRIYVVGSHAVRQSVFYTHPRVEFVYSLDDIRSSDWY